MKWPNPIWMWNFCVWIRRFYCHQRAHHSRASDSQGACHAVKLKRLDVRFVCTFCCVACANKWTTKRKQYCRWPITARASVLITFWIWVGLFANWCREKTIDFLNFSHFRFQTTVIWLHAPFLSKTAPNIADFWWLKRCNWFWWNQIRSALDGAVSFYTKFSFSFASKFNSIQIIDIESWFFPPPFSCQIGGFPARCRSDRWQRRFALFAHYDSSWWGNNKPYTDPFGTIYIRRSHSLYGCQTTPDQGPYQGPTKENEPNCATVGNQRSTIEEYNCANVAGFRCSSEFTTEHGHKIEPRASAIVFNGKSCAWRCGRIETWKYAVG